MKRSTWIFLALASAWPQAAPAQQAASFASLNETQRQGLALFVQSCGICHQEVQMTSAAFGPILSRDSLGGREAVMREVIANGTPRMPGFKHQFAPAQIDAIVAYLKTVPSQPPATPQR
jgi:mono/diheme cytochrome c family protein